VSEAFWQAKIQGLLYDFDLNKLRQYSGDEAQPFLNALQPIEPSSHLLNAHLITEASDRAVLNAAKLRVNGSNLKIAHLLSGAELPLSLESSTYNSLKRGSGEDGVSGNTGNGQIDSKQQFWWLWRCLPQAISQQLGDESLLMPAATVLPDASVWSHASLTAALAGALTGYERPSQPALTTSHPYLATFSFTPIQELIKASRKMRDFWAGSWVLHYLSAKICWKLAQIYGPDCLIYPSLYQQPLIDHWLLEEVQKRKWQSFTSWVEQPSDRALLTAGFPNVIVALLPKAEVRKAMQTARQTLMDEWSRTTPSAENSSIGHLVFQELERRRWMPKLRETNKTWSSWLEAQWQTYWTALPVGIEGVDLVNKAIPETQANVLKKWSEQLNHVCNLKDKPEQLQEELFLPQETQFIQAVYQKDPSVSVNVGSWWPYIFDQLRFAATSGKSCRVWKLPTAFVPRSTISGFGPVVCPNPEQHHLTERDTDECWQRHAGLFDGIEELNATETLKRGLHKVLPRMLFPKEPHRWTERLPESYPDLSSGVAGWLRTHPENIDYFLNACEDIKKNFDWTINPQEPNDEPPATLPWGIPWVAQHYPQWPNSRILNAGWVIDDFQPTNPKPGELFTRDAQKRIRQAELRQVEARIAKHFPPGNNPTDWYVLAAGDGDGMSQWLKGERLKDYQDYMPAAPERSDLADPETQSIHDTFDVFKTLKKRMGPSTHNALSRALLDFSNQLVPYLTEQRYAGRLIYSGGDDVLAYTNLWEWDSWLWDIRQCFRGADDPSQNPADRFRSEGDYWQWDSLEPPEEAEGKLHPRFTIKRPLFTMGHQATLSFGIVIAHHSVPLAIALENLWAAEEKAKAHKYQQCQKDAVQVRVLFGNGNILKSTSKLKVFNQWRTLLTYEKSTIDGAIFEQAAQLWNQHPAPSIEAIEFWTIAFCDRRDIFKDNPLAKRDFQQNLTAYLRALSLTTPEAQQDDEIQNWFKLTAFILRNRDIDITLRKAS